MMFVVNGDGNECQPSTSSSIECSQPCRHYELPEILLATGNFDESLVIGQGGFGKVYKGNIMNGSSVTIAAIKRLDPESTQGEAEFWTEVEMLSKLRHCHLVSLIGYCNHEKEMILIYEYMPNGTLDDHLHRLNTPLSWVQRLKICIGAARGLHYLHTGIGIEAGIIHRDVKTSNILLHESWAAKISDFGLSKIGPTNQLRTYVNTLVRGTFGYLDPHYYATGRLTRKSDVYAFGVVLLEVLCRKRAVDISLEEGLATWAQESIKEGNLKHIIDSTIMDQMSQKCLKEYVRIAERCLLGYPKHRPTMAEVVVSLESVLTLQEKLNRSLQPAGRTIFGRMVDKFPFPSNGEKAAHSESELSSNTLTAGNKELTGPIPSLMVFKFVDLRRATRNFRQDLLLGKDRFGEVFLGWVDSNTFAPSTEGVGIPVAVKKYRQGLPMWQIVVTILGRLAHPNIISLMGYCNDKKHECLLVYEYNMENKNFGHFLFGNERDVIEPLSWRTRLMIMIGVARGLTYMHSSKDQIIHRDVKTSNIFLDEDFNARLGNFEMAIFGRGIGETDISTHVMGTYGYVEPEYVTTGLLSVKSDIYSFGVVLLETLTGQEALEKKWPAHQNNLVGWTRPFLSNRIKLKKIMDPRLEQNYPLEGAYECAVLALRCVAKNRMDRPSSEEALRILEKVYNVYK